MRSIKKAYKFRIYPTKEQAVLINKTIGCTRFVFNQFLAEQQQKDAYWYVTEKLVQSGQLPQNNWKGGYFNGYNTIKKLPSLKKEYSFLKEVDSVALQTSVENLADGYTRYYRKQNERPRFKSKRNKVQSYSTKATNGNIAILDRHIKLPKLGLVKFAKSKEVHGTIKRATIRRNPAGKYFISLLVETIVVELPKTQSSVGVDVGLKDFAILSTGEVFHNPKWFRTLEDKLIKAQRILSRRIRLAKERNVPLRDAKNVQKQRIKVARFHEKITNARNDYLHKISTYLVKNHDIIGIEDLQVRNMMNNRKYAKSIGEASWYTFRTMLTYKCDWYGKTLVVVSKTFPSSQLCSCCGFKNKAVKEQNLREWTCPKCHVHHDRDLNASYNLRQEAERLLHENQASLTEGTSGIA